MSRDVEAGRLRLITALESHSPSDGHEAEGHRRLLTFVRETPDPFSRITPAGHVTGSMMVLDGEGRALLLHHRRLDLWLQPGGHLEGDEVDAFDAAAREAQEETGLTDLRLDKDSSSDALVFDVDVHLIPACEKHGEAAHFHFDVCYLARTRSPKSAQHAPGEAKGLRWVTADLDGLNGLDRATLRRLTRAFE